MNIVLVSTGLIPVTRYGGIERVIWCLGKELVKMGHEVTYLVKKGSSCNFAAVLSIDERRDIIDQVPATADLVHFHFSPDTIGSFKKPYIITMHGNTGYSRTLDKNTVFVSKNHANRYGSDCFVYNGLDWSEYKIPDFSATRTSFHFLGKAAWRIKNVKGAIAVIKGTKAETLNVIGGRRFNIKMGIRFTFSRRIRFYGMLGGTRKDELLNGSKGLIFPVRWHEPFGLSIIESLYFGCPVFGTPYGSLPELVPADVGYLSNRAADLTEVVENYDRFSNRHCHEYAAGQFNSGKMAQCYLDKYREVLAGRPLNDKPPELVRQTGRFLDWHD